MHPRLVLDRGAADVGARARRFVARGLHEPLVDDDERRDGTHAEAPAVFHHEARAFVDESMHIGRPEPWRDIQHRLRKVASEEDADETVGALRELLELEDLLFAPNTPPAV